MAASTIELKQVLLRYINNYDDTDRLREVLQTTSVEDRCKALMNVRGGNRRTAVHVGGKRNDMDNIKYMMAGFTSNQQYNVLSVLNSDNCTALHYTTYFNSDTAIVMYLLSNLCIQQRYNILRKQDKSGKTALHDAATKKHKSVLQVMLSSVTPDKQKLLLNIKNNYNKTIADITSLPELPYDVAAWTRLDLDNTNVELNNTKEELNNTKEKLNNTKEMLDRAKEELTELSESHQQQGEIIASQSDAMTASSKQMEELVEKNKLQTQDLDNTNVELNNTKEEINNTKEELNNTKEKLDRAKEEFTELKERQESAVARQDAELCSTREELDSARGELDSTKNELTALRESHQQQGEIIASQSDALIQMTSDLGEQRRLVERETNQRVEELSALKETHEAVVAGQNAELSALKETQEAVVEGQNAELQQLRYNQTEMLRMIEALEISLGKPTSDQENEC